MVEQAKRSNWEIREMERRLNEMKKEMVSLRKDVDRRFSRVDRQFWDVYEDMNTQWRWIGTIVMVIVAVFIVAAVEAVAIGEAV
jgi:hypothetical protein